MKSFYDIIGQSKIVEHLQTAIRTQQVSHAYIFNGEDGSGKKTLARIFAETLECEEGGINPCGKCHACHISDSGNNPDIITITHEKSGSISVDEIREQLIADITIKPYYGRKKVYIVPDATLMTVQAQNALLKTIEEPPEYAVIILLTDNKNKLLSTILSRSLTLEIRPIKDTLVSEYLVKNKNINEYKAQLTAAFARGNIGRALKLTDNEEFEEIKSEVIRVLSDISSMKMDGIMESVKTAVGFKEDIDDYLDLMLMWFRDVLLYKASGEDEGIIFAEEMSSVRRCAESFSFEKINLIIEKLMETKDKLASNVNAELSIETLLLSMK